MLKHVNTYIKKLQFLIIFYDLDLIDRWILKRFNKTSIGIMRQFQSIFNRYDCCRRGKINSR